MDKYAIVNLLSYADLVISEETRSEKYKILSV